MNSTIYNRFITIKYNKFRFCGANLGQSRTQYRPKNIQFLPPAVPTIKYNKFCFCGANLGQSRTPVPTFPLTSSLFSLLSLLLPTFPPFPYTFPPNRTLFHHPNPKSAAFPTEFSTEFSTSLHFPATCFFSLRSLSVTACPSRYRSTRGRSRTQCHLKICNFCLPPSLQSNIINSAFAEQTSDSRGRLSLPYLFIFHFSFFISLSPSPYRSRAERKLKKKALAILFFM